MTTAAADVVKQIYRFTLLKFAGVKVNTNRRTSTVVGKMRRETGNALIHVRISQPV
jgi:hypothetical protein